MTLQRITVNKLQHSMMAFSRRKSRKKHSIRDTSSWKYECGGTKREVINHSRWISNDMSSHEE